MRAGQLAGESLAATDALAAVLARPGDERVEASRAAVHQWLDEVGAETMGQSMWFVPIFITRARL